MIRNAEESKLFHGQAPLGKLSSPLGRLFHVEELRKNVDETANVEKPAKIAKTRRSRFFLRPAFLLGFSGACVLVALLLGSWWYFGTHYPLNTTVAGLNFANKTPAQAEEMLKQKIASFSVGVSTGDKALKPSNEELGIAFDTSKTMEAVNAYKKSSVFDRLKFWKKRDIAVVYSVDEEKLQKYFDGVVNQATTPAEDAVLKLEGSEVSVTPEKKGVTYGIENAVSKVTSALKGLEAVSLTATSFPSEPAFTTANLEEYKKSLESIVNDVIVITISDKNVTVPAATIGSWLVITPHPDTKKVDIEVDDGQIAAYIDTLAKPYVQPPKAKVITKDQATGAERVIAEGRSGTDVQGKQAVAASIKKAVESSSPLTTALTISYADYKTITAADYDKWLEVDVTNKRMYAYEKGSLVKSFLVTAGAPATPTVIGQFAIYTKYTKQDMRGLNADGTKYFQPNVQWVSYFYKDYAVHGNYWRPASYFGNVNSSHGCVGIVNDDAKFVYDWAPIGTPVIVHE